MKIVDGRGLHIKEIAKENKAKIKKFFYENPNSTIKKCCDALGFSPTTVRTHIKKIQSEEE